MKKRKITFFQKLDPVEGIEVILCSVVGVIGIVIALSASGAKGDADFFARLGIGIITFLLGGSFAAEKYKKTGR